MRFEICGNVEVLEDPSEFFGYPLDIRNGDVDLVFVGQWFALLCLCLHVCSSVLALSEVMMLSARWKRVLITANLCSRGWWESKAKY